MYVNQILRPFRRLQWRLTLRYSAVTVGTLLVIVLILGVLLFSRVFLPLDVLSNEINPVTWIQLVRNDAPNLWRYVLSQDPIDTELISRLMQLSDLQITFYDLLRVGDLELRLRTVGEGTSLLLDSNGILLGTSNPDFVSQDAVGQPLDTEILPGLDGPLEAALRGELSADQLFVTLETNEEFYFAVPLVDETGQKVLGVGIIYIENLPTENDVFSNALRLLGRSALILLFSAGLVGLFFGFLTAKGMANRLQHASDVTDAWSRGDFSEFIEDPAGDEISQLAVHLNAMAEQLQQYIKRGQEMAISEERSRLARDLHDSAKQEALAASFHLGAALTLFESDPEDARKHLLEADHLVDSVRRELTDLIHELRPLSMNGGRFDETLNEYLIDWAHQAGIRAALSVEGSVDLSLDIKQAVYRIMQEALANVARHSSAENVEVALQIRDHGVKFCVRDDGVGFDPLGQHSGMGLDSMRERAEAQGGAFSIASQASQGTQIQVTFPLE